MKENNNDDNNKVNNIKNTIKIYQDIKNIKIINKEEKHTKEDIKKEEVKNNIINKEIKTIKRILFFLFILSPHSVGIPEFI